MRHSLFLISFSLIIIIVESSGQDWAPVGSTWYYTPPGYGNCIYIKSVDDTVFNSRQSKLLEIRYCHDDMLISEEYIHQSGDSVFFLHDSTFVLLYNLAASIDDTIEVYDSEFIPRNGFLHHGSPEKISSFRYKVVGYDSVDIAGEWRKRQRIENLYNTGWKISIGNYPYIIDGIGSMCYFFGRFQGMIPEGLMGQLRCYSDDFVDWKNPSWTEDCDFLFTGAVDHSFPKTLLYPNPFSNSLRIEVENPSECIAKVFDYTGKLVIHSVFYNTVSIGDNLEQGLYLLRLELENQYTSYLIRKK
jgi:hypothetical protein